MNDLNLFNAILVPLDFSAISDRLVKFACDIATKHNAHIWYVHVCPPDPDFVGYESGPKSERDFIADKYRNEHRKLQEIAKHCKGKGIEATALLLQGSVSQTLINESDKLDIDLIIMGSHGHGALLDTLLGSVSRGVVKDAQCPVMIVPN